MNIYSEVIDARERISPFIKITDAEFSPYLSKITNGEVFLKLENTQYSGSFKLRGACNKILSLNEEEKSKGLITASSGPHPGSAGVPPCRRALRSCRSACSPDGLVRCRCRR